MKLIMTNGRKNKSRHNDFVTNKESAYNTWTANKMLEYTQFVEGAQQDYTDYTENKKDAYDSFVSQSEDDFNEWTGDQKAEYEQWYETHTTAWDNAFTRWFENVKGQLSEDAAGNLQVQLDEYGERLSRLERMVFTGILEAPIATSDGKLIAMSNGDVIEAVWPMSCNCNK